MADYLTTDDLQMVSDEIKEFLEKNKPRRIEPDDLTAPMIERAWGVQQGTAKRRLEQMVEDGEAVRAGQVIGLNGKIVTAYKLVKGKVKI